MMQDPLGVAVIGCGYWGVNYVRVLSESPNANVVAICDKDADRLAEVSKRFPDIPVTTDMAAMLQQDNLDAVVICTTAVHHFEVAQQCVAAGKHLLIEKPMTTTTRDAEQLVALASAANVKLMTGHIFLFNSGIEAIKSYVDSGEIGQLYYLHATRTNLGPIRRDVNALWDLATHDVSIFNYLLDSEPEWVSAAAESVLHNGREDVGFITLHYPGNVLGNIRVSWADPNKERRMVAVGSAKRVTFDDLDSMEKVRIFEKGIEANLNEPLDYGEFQLSIRDGAIISPNIKPSEPLRTQVEHFLSCVIEDRQPRTDGLNGLGVVRVMEAVDRSVREHGMPVFINAQQQELQHAPVY